MVKRLQKDGAPPQQTPNIQTEIQKEDKKLKRLEAQIKEATKKRDVASSKKAKHRVVTKIVPGKMKNKKKRIEMVQDMKKEKAKQRNLTKLKKKQIRLEKGEDA